MECLSKDCFLLNFTTFTKTGVTQNNRTAAGLIEFQSSVSRSVLFGCLWWTILGTPVGTSPVIFWRSCMTDVRFPFLRNLKERKEFWINFWYATVTLYWSRATRRYSNHILYRSSRIVRKGIIRSFYASILASALLHDVRVAELSVHASKEASDRIHISAFGTSRQSLSSVGMTVGPLFGGRFHRNRCFLNDDLFSLLTWFLVLWLRFHKVSFGCASFRPFVRWPRKVSSGGEHLFQSGKSALFLQQRIVANWVSERLFFLCWCVPMNNCRHVNGLQSCQIRCFQIQDWTNAHIITQSTHTFWIWIVARWCVCALCSVQLPSFLSESLTHTKLAFANFCWEACLLWHVRNGFAVSDVSHSVSRSSWVFALGHTCEIGFRKFWYFTMTSFFVLIVPTKAVTHCGVDAYLVACQNSVNDNCLCLSRTLKVNDLLALLGLDISFPEWFSTTEYWMTTSFKLQCHFPGDAIPFYGWFVQPRTVPLSFLSTSTETPMT